MKNFLFSIILFLFFANAGEVIGASPDYSKTPVFFVHGHGMSSDFWIPIINYLRDSNYPVEYMEAIDLVPANGGNIKAAETQINPAIETFLKKINDFLEFNHLNIPKKLKVDLVSHSMGALSSRWYASRIRPDRVRIWISLTGASHGSNRGCWLLDPGGEDVCPAFAKNEKQSKVQFQLNGQPAVADVDETPFGIGRDLDGVSTVRPSKICRILYVTIRIDPDEWIKPEDSSIVDGAGGFNFNFNKKINYIQTSPGNYLLPLCNDHDGIAECEDALMMVKEILTLYKE